MVGDAVADERLEEAGVRDVVREPDRLLTAPGNERPRNGNPRRCGKLVLPVLVDDGRGRLERRDQKVVAALQLFGVLAHEQHCVVEGNEQDRAPVQSFRRPCFLKSPAAPTPRRSTRRATMQ